MGHALHRTPTVAEAILAAVSRGDDHAATVMLGRAFGCAAGVDEADLPALLEELAEYMLEQDRTEEAFAAASSAVLSTPSPEADEAVLRRRCRVAEVLLKGGLVDEACALYVAVKQAAPWAPWVHEVAGSDHLDAGEPELALAWLTSGLELALDQRAAPEDVAPLLERRRAGMVELGWPPDDLDRRASALLRCPPAHHPEGDEVVLAAQLDGTGGSAEQVVRLLARLRRTTTGPDGAQQR